MTESNSELDQLIKQFKDTDEALSEGLQKEASWWSWRIGRIGIQRVFPSGLITLVYVLFNVITFVLGVIFSLLGGVFNSLGIALVVGSIFSAGTFVTQFWAVAVQRENETWAQVTGSLDNLKYLAKKRAALRESIELLVSQRETQDNSKLGAYETEDGDVHDDAAAPSSGDS